MSLSLKADRDVRDVIGHQLALEIEGGATFDAAAEKIRGAFPERFHWAISDAARVMAGGTTPPAWPQLGRLLAVARAQGLSVERTFAAYARSVERARAGFAGVFTGAMSLGIYLSMLAVILMLVVGVYALVVLPSFRTMFEQFGQPLPAYTAAMIGNNWVLAPALGLLVAALALYFLGLARLKERMHQMQPVLPVVHRVPGMRQWARAHDTSLWMRYYALFLDSGAQPEVAGRAAADLAGAPEGNHRPDLLEGAAKLGRLRAELARLLDADAREATERFERTRNTVVLALRLYVYVLLSGYVLAMYLPIFKIGTVV